MPDTRTDPIVVGSQHDMHHGPMTETVVTREYGIIPDIAVNLDDIPKPENEQYPTNHRHVVIQVEGRQIWLDIGPENPDHDFIDIRQFNSFDRMQGQGVFTIVNGQRAFFEGSPLPDANGTPVEGHGWAGGYCITLLTDKDGHEKASVKPNTQGNG